MGFPILPLLAGKFAAKILIGHMYGFHRIYRNILRTLKQTSYSNVHQGTIKDVVKGAFRAPKETVNIVASSNVTVKFINEYSGAILKKSKDIPPAIFFVVYKTAMNFQKTFNNEVSKRTQGK